MVQAMCIVNLCYIGLATKDHALQNANSAKVEQVQATLLFFFFNVCVFMCQRKKCILCVCVHGDQKRTLNLLKLKLQMVLSGPVYSLGNELRFSGRAASALNC